MSNALKFTERGEVRVTAQAASDDAVLFRVADTGVGIAPEDQGRIFDEFQQVDMPQQRRVKGSGLGLPLSRRLAELLGGTLTVASEPGAGSVFTLVLPRVLPNPLLSSSVSPARGARPLAKLLAVRPAALRFPLCGSMVGWLPPGLARTGVSLPGPHGRRT